MAIGCAFREAALGLWRTGAVGAVSGLSIGASLLLLGLFVQILGGARGLVVTLQDRVEADIYLREGTSRRTALGLVETVSRFDGVAEAVYVDKARAADEFREMFGSGLLDVLSTNPLPTSVRVRFERSDDMAGRIGALKAAVEGRREVESVDAGETWVASLDGFVNAATWIGIFLGGVLCAACAFAVSNTAKLMVLAQREAIEIMRLVGATGGFIRMTFLVGGGLQGLTGGVLAAAVLALGDASLAAWVPFPLPVSPWLVCTGVAVLGATLGVVGSWASLNRVLQAVG